MDLTPGILLLIGVSGAVLFPLFVLLAFRPPRCVVCRRGRLRWVSSRISGPADQAEDVVDVATCNRCHSTITQSHQYGWQPVVAGPGSVTMLAMPESELSWGCSQRIWKSLDRRTTGVARLSRPPSNIRVVRSCAWIGSAACLVGFWMLAHKAAVDRIDRILQGADLALDSLGGPSDLTFADDLADGEGAQPRVLPALGMRVRMSSRWQPLINMSAADANAAMFQLKGTDINVAFIVMHRPAALDPGSSDALTAHLRSQMAIAEAKTAGYSRQRSCRAEGRGWHCISVPDDPRGVTVMGWIRTDGDRLILEMAFLPEWQDVEPRTDEIRSIALSAELIT